MLKFALGLLASFLPMCAVHTTGDGNRITTTYQANMHISMIPPYEQQLMTRP